ncbi:polysaccharide lyase 8 family protein [Avibacterium sp. 20-129]|uniref:polysaccharide lyase 8 family protein n=1 Tax=Avibacterium sp. 20-129 TaxID=2911525 RepID=UPI0022473BEB|nr:polysaccharide lyase family 8 super-sandwich domain-containing protein [Avibacterium sp. 20-129]MCW9699142.1 polysaccharide lyase beta-sandwich domain-containing protein [Avibacterium sp. 20-129]
MPQFRLSKVMCMLAPVMLAAIPTFPVQAVTNSVLTVEQGKTQNAYDQILQNWKTHLTGISVDTTNNMASNAQQALLNNDTFDFSEQKTAGAKIRSTVNTIRDLAVGYNKSGSQFYQNQETKQLIISSLEKIHTGGYQVGGKEYGNWWHWEIGIPKSLNDVLILMNDDIPADLKEKLIAATTYFQPDPTKSGANAEAAKYSTSKYERTSTGGNRTDTSTVSLARGLLTHNNEEVQQAIQAIYDVGELKNGIRDTDDATLNDGFYADGSFIQHSSVAYNGTYASVLIEGLGLFAYMLKDSPSFVFSDPKMDNIYESLLKGYSWLLVNGGMNDAVNGRAITRENSSDITRAKRFISDISLLIDSAPEKYKPALQGLLKRTLLEQHYSIEDAPNNTVRNILKNILDNPNIKPTETIGVKRFSFMDRAVQKSPKGTVIIAMHSNRTAAYESMNGENLQGWYTGDGMTYIYDNQGTDSFTNYWHNVDTYMLPGTTESTAIRKDGSKQRRYLKDRSSKTFVGGVDNGIKADGSQGNATKAIIAMDFTSYNDKTTAKKSWVLLGDMVLALGSNIASTDKGEVLTTIDNRVINGKQTLSHVGDTISFTDPATQQTISYKILDKQQPYTAIEKGKDGSTEFAKIWLNHGTKPKEASYAYLIMPGYRADEANHFDTNTIQILRQNAQQHAVKSGNSLFINFFEAGEVDGLSVNKPLSVIKTEENGRLDVYVADPTSTLNDEINLSVLGKYILQVGNDVTATILGEKTEFTFKLDNHQKYFSAIEESQYKENNSVEPPKTETTSENSEDNPAVTSNNNTDTLSDTSDNAVESNVDKDDKGSTTPTPTQIEDNNHTVTLEETVESNDEEENLTAQTSSEQVAFSQDYLDKYAKTLRNLTDVDVSIIDNFNYDHYFTATLSESNKQGLGGKFQTGFNQSLNDHTKVGAFAEYRYNDIHQLGIGTNAKWYDFSSFIRYRHVFDSTVHADYLDLYLGYDKTFAISQFTIQPRVGVLGSYLLDSKLPDDGKLAHHFAVQTQLSSKFSYHIGGIALYLEPTWKVNLDEPYRLQLNGQEYKLTRSKQEWIGKLGIAKNIGNYTFDFSVQTNNHQERKMIATFNYQF